jgi:hypothetical protein
MVSTNHRNVESFNAEEKEEVMGQFWENYTTMAEKIL